MTLRYIGGPFDGLQIDEPPKGRVSMKPITEVHIGLSGGLTDIKSGDEANRKLQESSGNWAVYVLDDRIDGYRYLMSITSAEFEALASGMDQRLKEFAQARGLFYPF